MNNSISQFKQHLGCWIHERWRAELVLRFGIGDWQDLCNRKERLKPDSFTGGRTCEWKYSSHLTVCRLFPQVSKRLMQHCIQQWPIVLNFDSKPCLSAHPSASVLITISGGDRLPQFWLTLAALRAQTHKELEVVVVEQGPAALLRGNIPADVRYWHDVSPPGSPFNKSRAMNIAASMAKGTIVLIHDGDLLVPEDYVASIWARLQGLDGVRPGRLIFYLDELTSRFWLRDGVMPKNPSFDYVAQNTPLPIAMHLSKYWEVGGHDESFVGWGGEDVEFLSRLRTTNFSDGGWLPLVHLWHPPANNKVNGDRNQRKQDEKLSVPPAHRIKQLRSAHALANMREHLSDQCPSSANSGE